MTCSCKPAALPPASATPCLTNWDLLCIPALHSLFANDPSHAPAVPDVYRCPEADSGVYGCVQLPELPADMKAMPEEQTHGELDSATAFYRYMQDAMVPVGLVTRNG